ncbi:hypothetical protein P7K49_028147 [Saguinus oedipus]|uniref:Uncharacterized protein n=1 Tax=Saguinus oedipus TaxID=9490 RepID=A0ABQ9UBG8_SAGOE|nr:hypothetical protein P7K49_028147 [Saguinus oedipus]
MEPALLPLQRAVRAGAGSPGFFPALPPSVGAVSFQKCLSRGVGKPVYASQGQCLQQRTVLPFLGAPQYSPPPEALPKAARGVRILESLQRRACALLSRLLHGCRQLGPGRLAELFSGSGTNICSSFCPGTLQALQIDRHLLVGRGPQQRPAPPRIPPLQSPSDLQSCGGEEGDPNPEKGKEGAGQLAGRGLPKEEQEMLRTQITTQDLVKGLHSPRALQDFEKKKKKRKKESLEKNVNKLYL